MPGGGYVWWNQPPDGLDIPVIFVEVSIVGCNLKKFSGVKYQISGTLWKIPKINVKQVGDII
jgi:hypothetical protein